MEIVLEQGPLHGRAFHPQRAQTTIGRGSDNDLVLPDQQVSRRHATLERRPEGWFLTDLGSTNGTFLNGQQIQGRVQIQAGDRVSIGSSVLLVQSASPEKLPSEPKRRPQGQRTALKVAGALALIVVVIGLVFLLVTLLQPASEPAVPTPANRIEEMMTQIPIPTQMQGIMATVMPAIPTQLRNLPLLSTPTPTPGASIPALRPAQAGAGSAAVRAVPFRFPISSLG
jgi:pSer/pThr/pTyr-binding forkhead associated (FHA) protein